MDTSKIYIIMCRKAEEIQEAGRGIGVFSSKGNFLKYVSNGCGNISVWLPRTDQLQEMLDRVHWEKLTWLQEIGEISFNNCSKFNSDKLNTLEQLWIAIVMSQKYNKTWIDSEWAVCSN